MSFNQMFVFFISAADGKDKNVVFFFNAKTSIDDKNIFNVPDTCEPPTVVG